MICQWPEEENDFIGLYKLGVQGVKQGILIFDGEKAQSVLETCIENEPLATCQIAAAVGVKCQGSLVVVGGSYPFSNHIDGRTIMDYHSEIENSSETLNSLSRDIQKCFHTHERSRAQKPRKNNALLPFWMNQKLLQILPTFAGRSRLMHR